MAIAPKSKGKGASDADKKKVKSTSTATAKPGKDTKGSAVKASAAAAVAAAASSATAAAKKGATKKESAPKQDRDSSNGSGKRESKKDVAATPAPAVEQDFPRGAAPRTASSKRAAAPSGDAVASIAQEKGLFKTSQDAAAAPAGGEAERVAKKEKRRNSADGGDAGPADASSKKRKTKRNNASASALAPAAAAPKSASEETFRVEHMSYKRLLPGPTVLLAQIIAILPLELIVSLPGQLLGHIPITNISRQYTKRLEEDLEREEDEEEEESEEDAESDDDDEKRQGSSKKLPALSDMFHVGQFLRAGVVKVLPPKATSAIVQSFGARRGNEDWKSSRRAELSLEPELVNAGVTLPDLQKNAGLVLQGSVRSIEDNGYIVDLGVKSEGASSSKAGEGALTAFVGFKQEKKAKADAGSSWPKHKFTQGGVITVKVEKIAENGRMATVSVFAKDIAQGQLITPPSIQSLLPGTLVPCTISAIVPSGLNLRFLTFFTGTADTFHLPTSSPGTYYKVGQKVTARILWTCPPVGDSPTRFALSLLPHILALSPKLAPLQPGEAESAMAPLSEVLPVGTFLENLVVTKVEPEWGMICELQGAPDVRAFVHISHVNDEHLTSLAGTQYKPGMAGLRGRVLGYSALDGLLQVSTQPSVLERKFMKVSDLQIGEVLEGTVQRLTESALFVNIHGSVAGIVWPMHYSDLRLKHPERKFKPGSLVKTRVLALDSEKNRVVLTLKRSLVNSDLPVLANGVESAEVGQVLHATVHTFLPNGKDMLVELLGGTRVYVPINEVAEKFVTDIKKEVHLGQVLKVKIIAVDREQGRLTASIKQALDTYEPVAAGVNGKGKKEGKQAQPDKPVGDVSGIQVGDRVTGIISAIHESQVLLRISAPSKTGKKAKTAAPLENVTALLTLSSLAKNRDVPVDALRLQLSEGEELSDLVVVSKNAEKGLVILGHAATSASVFPAASGRTGVSAAAQGGKGVTFDTLAEGQVIEATIADSNPQGYFVQLGKGIRGKLRWTEIGDDYDVVSGLKFDRGTDVKVVVLDYDRAAKRIDLSARQSRLQPAEGELENSVVRDPVCDSLDDLAEGKEIRGFVRSISDAGVFVEVGKDLAARVQIKELFDDFVKDWKPRFAVGQLVSGKILSTDKATKKIEMTLRKNASAKRTKKDTGATVLFEGLAVGQIISGTVKRIEAYGAFIRLDGSTLSGLCHRSQFVEDGEAKPETLNELVSIGQKVKAVILDLNVEKKKIGLGMKPSQLKEAGAGDEEDDEEVDGDEENSVMKQLNKLVRAQEAASDEDDEDEGSDDDELQILMGDEDNDDNDDEEEAQSEDEEPAGPSTSAPANNGKAPLKLSNFKWDGEVEDGMNVDEAAESASDDDEDEEEAASSKKAKPASSGILINDQTGSLSSQLPTSPSDFDRLVLANPNSSELWISYMSYYLGLSDLESARQIAQRALKTINYREEEEKLNIWVALINLENQSSDEDALDTTINKALQHNDPKKVYQRTVELLEATENSEKATEVYERFIKKFNMASKAWTLYGGFLLRRGKSDAARELLPRSLKSLPKRKHIKTISQFALMEFKMGDPERGRTIFEGIVDSYAKRLDLWWIYIDQEIRLRNVAGVRALFDRVLATKLSSKKTKSVLKKWLGFEKEHGDEQGAEAVKQRAVAYVQQLQDRE